MKRHLLLILALFVAAALAACSGEVNLLDETKLTDTSLLTGDPCEAPCWNGITPGETSFRDAKLIIESDQRYSITEEPDQQEGNPARVFLFTEGENQGCCQMVSRDGETISSFMLQMAPVMSFGPVFDNLGEPRYIDADKVSEEQAYMAMVYPELPMVLFAFIEGAEQGAISVTSEIIGAMYMGEAEMEQMLSCNSLHDWEGFLPFSSYADENYEFVGESVGDAELCPTE